MSRQTILSSTWSASHHRTSLAGETGRSTTRSSYRTAQVHPRYAHEVVDVTAAGYQGVLADRVEALGGIDLCVFAAGIGEFVDVTDLSAQTSALQVNLLGAARTIEVVVPPMVSAGAGHVVGLSSLADVAISGQVPGYAASKAGLSAYLQGLALALRPDGVDVTTARFGFVDTKMAKADSKSLMISAEKAVDVLIDALRTRRAGISYPRPMALAVRILRAVSVAQLRAGRSATASCRCCPGSGCSRRTGRMA
jgi:short-subunit dehydrogenase